MAGGIKTFTATTLSVADVNNYLMNQANIVCTSSTRPSSPVPGMSIYETDTDLWRYWNGSVWFGQGVFQADASSTLIATTTNPTLGTGGTINTRYSRTGKTVYVQTSIAWGSTGTTLRGSGTYGISLPVTAASTALTFPTCGIGRMRNNGVDAMLEVELQTTTNVFMTFLSGTNATGFGTSAQIASTTVNPWITADFIRLNFQYEAA